MRAGTALLVSENEPFIASVRNSKESIDNLNLEVAPRFEDGIRQLKREDIVLVLLHVTRSTEERQLQRCIKTATSEKKSCATVLFTDFYRHEQAITYLRAGASDYLGLPIEQGRLTYLLDILTMRSRFGRPNPSSEQEKQLSLYDPAQFVMAPEMAELMEQIRRIAPSDTTLMLTGETGTGKTRLARLIHELSPRRDEPFLVVDCGALSPNLVESEMFGHARGAFTGADRERIGKFAAAGNGTILLDEINSLPPSLQSKLLRAVDDRVFEAVGSNKGIPLRARIIAASNTSLEEEVARGRFRSDLYFRLNVVELYLTPLRERPRAIAFLASKFLAEFAARNNRDIFRMAPEVVACLEEFHWPGNIRELRNVMERAVALCRENEITTLELPEALRSACSVQKPLLLRDKPEGARTLAESKEEVEVLRIMQALHKNNNNRLRTAADLGISRMALYKKLHKYGLFKSA